MTTGNSAAARCAPRAAPQTGGFSPRSSLRWPALDAARADHRATRVPFVVGGAEVGSVARGSLDALHALTRGDDRWRVEDAGMVLAANDADAVLHEVNDELRAQCRIAGWRDELVDVPGAGLPHGSPPRMERAAARFRGTTTVAAHLTGWVANIHGHLAELWIARRAMTKTTDPGRLDNLVGGGVAAGKSPDDALVLEAREGAGLEPGSCAASSPAVSC